VGGLCEAEEVYECFWCLVWVIELGLVVEWATGCCCCDDFPALFSLSLDLGKVLMEALA
jgi:hypothetical protein